MWGKISASNTRNSLNSYQELNSCRISQDRKDWVNIRDFFRRKLTWKRVIKLTKTDKLPVKLKNGNSFNNDFVHFCFCVVLIESVESKDQLWYESKSQLIPSLTHSYPSFASALDTVADPDPSYKGGGGGGVGGVNQTQI